MKYNLFSLGILALSSQMVMAYEKGKKRLVLADGIYDVGGVDRRLRKVAWK